MCTLITVPDLLVPPEGGNLASRMALPGHGGERSQSGAVSQDTEELGADEAGSPRTRCSEGMGAGMGAGMVAGMATGAGGSSGVLTSPSITAAASAIDGMAGGRGRGRGRGIRGGSRMGTGARGRVRTCLHWQIRRRSETSYPPSIALASHVICGTAHPKRETNIRASSIIQIFLIIINESSGPPLVSMLVCKHWHAIVTTIWASLNLGTRTPMDVVAEKLRRNQWFLDVVVDTESDRGDFAPSDSAFEAIFAAMEATSRWRSLVVESFPGQADLPEHLVNRGLRRCPNAAMSRFTTLKVKCACEASPLLDGLLRILGTTASSKLTTMEIISENVVSFLAPAYPSIFHSVTTLSLDTLRIRNPVDLLPHLYQLETLTASHISFPIYHDDINLPFVRTLRHLSLRASSIQWMSGRTFHVLEHCTLVFPLHHHVLHTFRTTLPNCEHLTFQGFPLDILNGISARKLVQLSVTCSGSSNGRGGQQLAQLSCRALGESRLAPKILHIRIKATNQAWMNALAFMSNLEELEIHNAQPSSLGAKVFQLLVVQPAHAGTLGIPSTPEEVGAPLCPLLRRLGLKYDRWLRQSEQFDLIPVFMSVIRSRQYSNCPLESFSLWMRNDQRDPLELIEGSQMSVEGVKRLAKESGIEDGLLDFTAMQSFPPLVPLLAGRDSDQQKQYKPVAISRRKRVSQALQTSISWFCSRF